MPEPESLTVALGERGVVDTASLSVRQVVHTIVKRFPPCQSQSPSP